MKMNDIANVIFIGLILTGLSFGAVAQSDEPSSSKHALGTGFGSYGANLFYTYKYSDKFHMRAGVHGFGGEDETFEISDIKYEGDLDGEGFGVSLDWYPLVDGWKQKLFFTGGLTQNSGEFTGEATSKLSGTINVGGAEISPGDIDGLTLEIEQKSQLTPHIGIGFGNKTLGDRGFSFMTEIGVAYTEKPNIKLTANDPSNNLTQANLSSEKKQIEDEFDRVVGYASVGVSYHF